MPPRLRLLLVDDDSLLRRALSRILQDHEVAVCASGADALALLGADRNFDVILCDVQMPAMDGMQMFEAATRLDAALAGRFLFLTGGACDDRTDAFLAAHASRVLWKPVTPNAVRAAIRANAPRFSPAAP